MQVFKDIKIQAVIDISYDDVKNWIDNCDDKQQLFKLRHCLNNHLYDMVLEKEPDYEDDFRSRA